MTAEEFVRELGAENDALLSRLAPDATLKPEVEGLKLDASEVEILQPEEIWQRVTELELKVEQLSHFITREQRPDLTRGARQGEPPKPAAARRSTRTTRRRNPRG